MSQPRSWRLLLPAVALVALHGHPRVGLAQPSPMRLRVTFQPDCHRSSLDAACDPRKSGMRLDLGPQIAIWIEAADGTFVDTLMVTNLTAVLGIGNRPGYYRLPSGPKFPYGRRIMSLPVWAHRRGKLYDSVVMQDGTLREYWLGFHELISSPDPYFCRPMTFGEVDVDAVSCPTARFNSAKGRFFDPAIDLGPDHLENGQPKEYVPPPRSYYPPRNDLVTFTSRDCDLESTTSCVVSARRYAEINDLDGVAAATPPYGKPFSQIWRVPDGLPDGEYAVLVEINKEFDESSGHRHPAVADLMLREWGMTNNFGQPSVVFRTPFTLDRRRPFQGVSSRILGYGDWDGQTGTLHPPDDTILDAPGSGSGRLLSIAQPALAGGGDRVGRLHVVTEPPLGPMAGPAPAATPPDGGSRTEDRVDAAGNADAAGAACPTTGAAVDLDVSPVEIRAEGAELELVEPASELWTKTDHYEVRVWYGDARTRLAFESGRPIPRINPEQPGKRLRISLDNLKSESLYTVGIRPSGRCLDPPIAYLTFTTVIREFSQLSGCFIATAAYGGPLAPKVDLLRRFRDRARAASPVAAALADGYARSSPPLADLLRGSPAARAAVRTLLAPIVGLLAGGER